MSRNLKGMVAVVAGATRGAGRGIACMLGESGATVYCTGRSTRATPATEGYFAGRPETIEETAEMVTARGGAGLFARVDHTQPEQVKALFHRIQKEQGGLDVLVNDISEGDSMMGTTFWKAPIDRGLAMLKHGIHSHIVTSHFAAPLMFGRATGLIVEMGDGDGFGYRGNLFHDLVKTSVIRLAFAMAYELRKRNIAAIALTPGYMRTESVLDHFGVTEQNWREGAKKDPNFLASETPFYAGRAVAALAADPNVMKKTGRIFTSGDLAAEYGFTDIDGSRPHLGRHFEKQYGVIPRCDDGFYAYWSSGYLTAALPDWPD